LIVLANPHANIKAVSMNRRTTPMKKISSNLMAALSTIWQGDPGAANGDWTNDPFRHPAIEAMSIRELGDLPMPCLVHPACPEVGQASAFRS